MLRKAFDLFIFSSLFIAICAVVMTVQTNHLFQLDYKSRHYAAFVFFSTICSYNFHWYLTPAVMDGHSRAGWTHQNRTLHLVLFFVGMIGAGWYFFAFVHAWLWLGIAVALTFLYSAPKLPYAPFLWLKKIAIGKTLFLALVWMYVTTIPPLILGAAEWKVSQLLFAGSRFFLIYAICILFDYRDREADKQDGIRSMITYFSEKGVDALFYLSIALFAVATAALYFTGFSLVVVASLLLPGLIVALLYRKAKRDFSDYLYYFVLDGLMMFSALFTLFM